MLLHKSVLHDSRVRREAAALADAGHDVTVLELAADVARPIRGLTRRSVAPPAWVRRVGGTHVHRVVFGIRFVVEAVRARPHVVHAHDAAMLIPGLLTARATGARLVYDSHELATGVPYREPGWNRFVAGIERIALPRCAAVITVSDGIADRLRARYGLRERPVVLRNSSALAPGEAPVGLRKRLGLRDEPLVVHQGAAAQDRGCDVLLKAVAALPGVHLCFLGDGDAPTVSRLREEARAFGIEDRVHFRPGVPLEQLLSHTAEADVGVALLQDTCENHRLALPNKLFEYLAAGVPVVVSDLPEMRRLVEGLAVGWWADPADATAVAEALTTALARRGDRELRSRVVAAAGELSWAREKERLVGLYEVLAAAS